MQNHMNYAKMLHPKLLEIMKTLGYKSLLPVQEKSIPVILSGHNTLIIAPTGSGKTEAALFPVLSMMLSKNLNKISGIKTVYITPLRALNRDITQRIEQIVSLSGFSIMLRHGDTTQTKRRIFLRNPPDLMVTTPESFNLLLSIKDAKKLFSQVRWVIVDEIHELIDNERGAELSVALERLQAISKYKIQRIALSATLSKHSIKEASLLLASGRKVSVVIDPSPKTYDIKVISVSSENFWKEASQTIAKIVSNIKGRVLVFVNTRGTAEKLGAELARILGSNSVLVHHGSLSRVVREDAEREFKEGKAKVLVATSSMELGIDIGDVDLVVQFLSPRSVVAMTQRAGRAGHRFGETSKAIIVTSHNLFEILESNVIAFRAMKSYLEDKVIHRNALDVLAHQLAGLVLGEKEVPISKAYDFLVSTGPFKGLGFDDFYNTIIHMDKMGILRLREDNVLRMGRRTISYFYKVSMIPDEKNYNVYDVLTGDKIGELSEKFIEAELARSEKETFRFVLAGRIWEALDIDFEKGRVEAKLLGEAEGLVPSWEGELIPVSYKVAREVCSLFSLCMVDENACSRILQERGVEKEQITKIVNIAVETRSSWHGVILGNYSPVIEPRREEIVLYACLGSKGNFTLAILLSRILEKKGYRVLFDYIPYAIVFRGPLRMTLEDIKKALSEASRMDPVERRIMVLDAVKSSIAYTLRFLQVAKRMGVLEPDAGVPRELARRIVRGYSGTVVETEALRELVYDKLDFGALDDFLRNLRHVQIIPAGSSSKLLEEVYDNPYLKKDKAVDLKTVAISTLIESFKRRIRRKRVLFQCASCGYSWTASFDMLGEDIVCPKCGARFIAPLPDTEWGRETADYFKKFKKSGKKPRGEAWKRIQEVYNRAQLFIEYYREGLTRYVIEALMAPGVGPVRAQRVLNELLSHGEKGFYRELFKAIEEYSMNRKYWSTKSK